VELEAEGPPQSLEELRLWCEKGPPDARVSGVTITRIAPTGADWFEVRD
jgi:acylphosphatase